MYQQLTIVGNVGNDPVMRYTPDGLAVTTFSVAVNRRWKDGHGNTQERTTWFRCSAWGRLAETVHQYMRKGARVMVVGTVDVHTWQDNRSGDPRAQLEVRCDTVRFLDSRQGTAEEEPEEAQPAVMGDIAKGVAKGAEATADIPF